MFRRVATRTVQNAAGEYRSADVVRATGITFRQLQWWDERKVVVARHEGHTRIYSARQVMLIGILGALRKAGISLQHTRRILSRLKGENFGAQILLVSVQKEKLDLWATSTYDIGRLLPLLTKRCAVSLVAVNLEELRAQLETAGVLIDRIPHRLPGRGEEQHAGNTAAH